MTEKHKNNSTNTIDTATGYFEFNPPAVKNKAKSLENYINSLPLTAGQADCLYGHIGALANEINKNIFGLFDSLRALGMFEGMSEFDFKVIGRRKND